MIEIPCLSSASSSNSDSDNDGHLSHSKAQSRYKKVSDNGKKVHVFQNVVISNAGCSNNMNQEKNNEQIKINKEKIEVIGQNETEDKLREITENEIELEHSEKDLSEQAEDKKVDDDKSAKKLTRIRQRHTGKWACNIRKECFDRGEEYISVRKKLVPARKIQTKKDCLDKCIYKCAQKVSENQRKEIFSNYYKLDAKEKKMFILNTTVMFNPERRRKGKNVTNSKKKNSFKYFFTLENDNIQVCKLFYCGTLCISQKPIYNVHKNKTISNTPGATAQGKHKKKFTSQESANLVKEHINMFPRVQSHYCRPDTQKEYLEGDLSIQRMYDLYTTFVQEKGFAPVKYCIYRKIFCTQFNISFHKPKKDRCDLCAEIELKGNEENISEELRLEYEKHLKEKQAMRENRRNDRENDIPVLCFDLENVLSCPKAEIKNFFYKSKLSVYNMTAHLSVTKDVYCALWSEAVHGRSGNDIASAVYKILNQVLQEHLEFEEIILWSDSCVPQNKNSLMSFAMAHILQKFPHVKKITMKFSVPGHSCIQEVDAVHSVIERSLSKSEYFSPVSLLRLLVKIYSRKPYKIIQMGSHDFIDFQSYSMKMNYKEVPFSKITWLQFSKCFFEINYKTSFLDSDFVSCNLRPRRNIRGQSHGTADSSEAEIIPMILKKNDATAITLPQNKIEALRSMFKWMPQVDVEYYKTILPQNPTKEKKRNNKSK